MGVIALKILIFAAIFVAVITPFWRSTKKPPKNDANNLENEHSQISNYASSESDQSGGDAGGHH